MIQLTPAQIQFLKMNIAGFFPAEWTVSHAGFAGSDRRFLRIQRNTGDNDSFILILWDSRDNDWGRFLTIQKELADKTPFLPHIYASDDKHGLILEEDLGQITLKQYVTDHPTELEQTYLMVLDALIEWQKIDFTCSGAIASRSMDLEIFLWESQYFATHCVSEFFGCDALLTKEWEKERTDIALEASKFHKVCIHRDFQSENILICKGAVRFVDYQGARLGPAGYDLASLVFDPYIAALDHGLSEKLISYYQNATSHTTSIDSFYICSLQRLMQALGAYGNLSIHKGKERYRQFIPRGVDRCIRIVDNLPQFPQLKRILYACREKN